MSRLPDEQWDMIEDSINKKRIAQSARNRRTHCDKGGSVKFPSDFMTKKELKAMNGEMCTYKLNSSMSWGEFMTMPTDIQQMYMKSIQDKYKIPNKYLADVMGTSPNTLGRYLSKTLHINIGQPKGAGSHSWSKTEEAKTFYQWWGKVPTINEDEPVIIQKEIIEPVTSPIKNDYPIPTAGTIDFDNVTIHGVMETLSLLLGTDRYNFTIGWCEVNENSAAKED